MDEFVFEVFITAVVRVRAETEADARQVVTSSAIAAPSAAEISLANQANFIEGKNASITDVDFSADANSIKLHEEVSTSQPTGPMGRSQDREPFRPDASRGIMSWPRLPGLSNRTHGPSQVGGTLGTILAGRDCLMRP